MKTIFFLLILFLAASVFALTPYTMPGQKPDLNTGKYGTGQAITPTMYSSSPEIQALNSINSVFPSLNNIDFISDGNISIIRDLINSKIILGFSKDINSFIPAPISNYWDSNANQTGLNGNKAGSFDLVTNGVFQAGYFTSTIGIGTAPFFVTSTDKVNNLNADSVDGLHSEDINGADSLRAKISDSNNPSRLNSIVIANAPWLISFTDTNAQTACHDANSILAGDGNCVYYNVGQTFLPDKIKTINGTDFNNIDINAIKYYDANSYTVREANGANPLTIDVNFAGIISFDSFIMREKYSGGQGHEIIILIFDYVLNDWEEYFNITDQESFEVLNAPVVDFSDHIKNGVVSLRFNHVQNGISSHYFYLDFLWLLKGTTTSANFSHNSLSGRDSTTNHPWAMPKADINNFASINSAAVADWNKTGSINWLAITGVPFFNQDQNSDINQMINEKTNNFVPYQNATSDLNLQLKNISAKDVNLYRAGKITFFDSRDINSFSFADLNYGKTTSTAAANAIDSSANAVNATQNGTVPTQTGQINGARGAYSSANYFSLTNSTIFSSSQSFTITGWLRVNTLNSTQDFLDSTGAGSFFQLLFRYTDSTLYFSICKAGVACTDVTKSQTFSNNTWYWFTFIFNSATNGMSVNVNNSGTPATTTYNSGAATASSAFNIGYTGGNAADDTYFDDFRIYDSVLSAGDLSSIYNSGTGTESAVATTFRWYKLNETNETTNLPSIMKGIQTTGAFAAVNLLSGAATPNDLSPGDINISGKSYFSGDANFSANVKILGTLIGGSPVKVEGGLNVLSGAIQAKEIESSVIYSKNTIYYKTITPQPICIMADNNAVVACLPKFSNGIYSFVCETSSLCDSKTKELELLDEHWTTAKSKFKDDKNKE